MRAFLSLIMAAAVLAAGCNSISIGDLLGGGSDADGGDTTGTTDDGGGDGDGTQSARSVTGTVNGSETAKRGPRSSTKDEGYQVVVQSAETMMTYMGTTDAEGNFEIEIPDDETGDLFIVTVVGPDSRALGPVVFGQDGTDGFTGLEVGGPVSLGTLDVGDDPNSMLLVPGEDADLADGSVADDVKSRLNEAGVPVGVPSVGKGDEANIDAPSDDPRHALDSDQDGLVDLFDADDNGNGKVDDFEPEGALSATPFADVLLNVFMNLKIEDVTAEVFYSGDEPGIEEILRTRTVITFEIKGTSTLTKTITGARVIGPPAPSPLYLPMMTLNDPSFGSALWSSTFYALRPDGTNHFQEWAVPNDFINAGDTFTVEVKFDDGTTAVLSRMINFVFRSIPKLVAYGAPGSLTPYTGPGVIEFDGTQDLALEWNPPVDERGRLLVGQDYHFEVFFLNATGQQIDPIDTAATWPTPPAGWNTMNFDYEVPGSVLSTPSSSGSFTVSLPKEIFVDEVQTPTGPVAVASYKIDIAAQNNGNNSALMIRAEKAP